MKKIWSLSAKKIDSTKLFQELEKLFSGPYTVFLEGTSISDELISHYQENSSNGDYLPEKGTIMPRSNTFSCNATKSFWMGLIELSKDHAEPELFDHFFIYQGSVAMVEWWDAFLDPLCFSSDIKEDKIYLFASRMGLMIKKIKIKNG